MKGKLSSLAGAPVGARHKQVKPEWVMPVMNDQEPTPWLVREECKSRGPRRPGGRI